MLPRQHCPLSELIVLPGISTGVDTERFREKALAFLRDKLEDPAFHKVRSNEPLTSADLESLEQMLVEAIDHPK
ncbi:MAG: type I restriction-modification enzyme R subunit C-terminal domain-containing protein [Silvibacterium sp.]